MELCGDGHEKVIVKVCKGDPLPMKRKTVNKAANKALPYGNGWFMVLVTIKHICAAGFETLWFRYRIVLTCFIVTNHGRVPERWARRWSFPDVRA
jgi:hypothetical protein